MTANDIWALLERHRPERRMRFGLDAVRAALDARGAPDQRFASVIVAGTNGKGSTARFVEAGLRRAGLRVATYASPHVFAANERVRIDGREVAMAALTERVTAAYHDFRDLTYFELLTVAACELFGAAGADWAVLEVGLGGRLDATNAVRDVRAAVITSIGLDHQEWLGASLEEIAREKAGVLRPGVPWWSGPLPEAADAAVAAVATAVAAPRQPTPRRSDCADWAGPAVYLDNLALGAAVAAHVGGAAASVVCADLATRPPFRWQTLRAAPRKIVDGAHNPDGVRALLPAIVTSFVQPPTAWLLIGRSKDAAAMVRLLADHVSGFVLVDHPDRDAWTPAAALAAMVPPGSLRGIVAAAAAPREFLAAPQAALWLGTLRGLAGFRDA